MSVEHRPLHSRPLGRLVCLAAAWLAATTAPADAPYALRQEKIVTLRIQVLEVQTEQTLTVGSEELALSGSETSRMELPLEWGALILDVSGQPGDEHTPHRIKLHSALTTGGRRFTSNRDLVIREAGTQLVDIYEDDDRRVVLALRAESDTRPVAEVYRLLTPGDPVRLSVEIERVDGDRFIPLETNILNTFVGLSVEYSFRRGAGDSAESVLLRMRPVRIAGSVAELVIEVTGSLPGDPDRLLLSRRETLVSTRGAMSSVTVSSGDPPSGYRFRITPDF
jgi:hypothetical protein